MDTRLFSPIKIRELVFRNRIFMAPMCQYSANEGLANHWHLVHLGARAVGGVGLVVIEATGVCPEGRISNQCLGLYNEKQKEALKPIVDFIRSQGAAVGIQLNHSGRKGVGDFMPVGPSALAFSPEYKIPRELSIHELVQIKDQFALAARRAIEVGIQVVELHMAHGYLMHQFLSPVSNQRRDQYGGSLENRMRFPLQVVEAVRAVIPDHLPLFVRISATDWIEPEGWDLFQSIELAKQLKIRGVDLIDVSSGGNVAQAEIPSAPGYQVCFSQELRLQAQILTGAVGLITSGRQAEEILSETKADVIFVGRKLLSDPHFALHAALQMGEKSLIPFQYRRGF